MSTFSQPLCIGMINICIQINGDITLNPDNSHLDSCIILWHNQHNIFVYLPNRQNTICYLPGTLFKTLIPFLGAPQTFMHCGPRGACIGNCQSNPTQTLFVEGVFVTDPNDPCSSHQCKLLTPTFLTSNSIPPSYPALFSLTSKKKLIQLPSGSDLPMMTPPKSIIQTPLLPHQHTGLAFLWDQEIPNRQSAHSLWATSPPGSTLNARHIITNKVVSSFESLSSNTPLGVLLTDDMGLGKTIQAISLIGTSKEWLITNPQCSRTTIIICSPRLITNWKSEISKHAQAGVLQVKIYHGPTHHSLSESKISKFDIIITSYNTITQAFKQTHTFTSFIFEINWHHIILDEAQ
ncbi:hypothetical protein O181_080224 [Austropuccinia psidii MF-1]|uniref:Helicase ATP-binding domain-containing protein n=1 Tax=Austropuccinia psidii MF-1 TaxID=1389203 RepID=A0A9Q3FJZ6_9BASI|nr:hypothetical protein [Austropuccinia psidii MF-1]